MFSSVFPVGQSGLQYEPPSLPNIMGFSATQGGGTGELHKLDSKMDLTGSQTSQGTNDIIFLAPSVVSDVE